MTFLNALNRWSDTFYSTFSDDHIRFIPLFRIVTSVFSFAQMSHHVGKNAYAVLTGGMKFVDHHHGVVGLEWLQYLDHHCVDADHVCAYRATKPGESVELPFAYLGGPQLYIPDRYKDRVWRGSDGDACLTGFGPELSRWSEDPNVHRCVLVIAAHGLRQYMQIGDSYWPWQSVRDLLLPVASKPILVILDGCYSAVFAAELGDGLRADSGFTGGVWIVASAADQGATAAIVVCKHASVPVHPNGAQAALCGSMFHRSCFQVFLYLPRDLPLEELPDELNRYQPGRAGFYAVLVTVPATNPELAADPPSLRQFVGPPIVTPAASARPPPAPHPVLPPLHRPPSASPRRPPAARRSPGATTQQRIRPDASPPVQVQGIRASVPPRSPGGFFDDPHRSLRGEEKCLDFDQFTLPSGELNPIIWVGRCVHCDWDPVMMTPVNVRYGRLQADLDRPTLTALEMHSGDRLFSRSVDIRTLFAEVETVLQTPLENPRSSPQTEAQLAVELHGIANYLRLTEGFGLRHRTQCWWFVARLAPYLWSWSLGEVIRVFEVARAELVSRWEGP
jgi:hypothetical protein